GGRERSNAGDGVCGRTATPDGLHDGDDVLDAEHNLHGPEPAIARSQRKRAVEGSCSDRPGETRDRRERGSNRALEKQETPLGVERGSGKWDVSVLGAVISWCPGS